MALAGAAGNFDKKPWADCYLTLTFSFADIGGSGEMVQGLAGSVGLPTAFRRCCSATWKC